MKTHNPRSYRAHDFTGIPDNPVGQRATKVELELAILTDKPYAHLSDACKHEFSETTYNRLRKENQ